jgi:Fe2+ or Zn2+ uptake regulation protein
MPNPLDRILERLPDAKRQGHRYRAKCPRHDGKHRDSLSLSEGEDGAALVYCFGGCETADVLRTIGLELKDLYPDTHPGAKGQRPKAGWSWKKRKDRLAVDAEKIAIQFASLTVLKLLYPVDGKPPGISDIESEAVAPYNALLEELWTVFHERQNHEDVQQAWVGLLPELSGSAPNLVAAVDRHTQAYLRSFSREAGDKTPLMRGKKAADLLRQTFTPPKEIVPGLLSEGLTAFVGKPKVGKSRCLLAIAVAVATGGKALGVIPVDAGDVLYISLEDHERRLQKRISGLLGREPCPDTLEYEREWRRLDEGGLEDLELWIARHPRAKLIVVDTFKRVKSRKRRNGSAYDEDYEAMEGLQDLANRHPGLAIVINHHENKMDAVDDWMDRASGSTGFTGGVDGAASMRRQRGSVDAVLTITHRDIDSDEGQYQYALKSDQETGGWTLMGDAEKYQMSQQQQDIYRVLEQASTPMGPKAIALALGKTDEKSIAVIYVQLNRMLNSGKITSQTHGKYEILASLEAPTPARSPTHTHTVKDVKDVKDAIDVQVVKVPDHGSQPRSLTSTDGRVKDGESPAGAGSEATLTTLTSTTERVKDAESLPGAASEPILNNLNTRTRERPLTLGAAPTAERCVCGSVFAHNQRVCFQCRRPREVKEVS